MRLEPWPAEVHGPPYQRASDNFHEKEFRCFCCGRVWIALRLIDVLEKMRLKLGSVPVNVTLKGGCRCPPCNAGAQGVPDSRHLIVLPNRPCDAADIQVPPYSPAEVFKVAEECGGDGIHAYWWGVHVDTRGYRARW